MGVKGTLLVGLCLFISGWNKGGGPLVLCSSFERGDSPDCASCASSAPQTEGQPRVLSRSIQELIQEFFSILLTAERSSSSCKQDRTV